MLGYFTVTSRIACMRGHRNLVRSWLINPRFLWAPALVHGNYIRFAVGRIRHRHKFDNFLCTWFFWSIANFWTSKWLLEMFFFNESSDILLSSTFDLPNPWKTHVVSIRTHPDVGKKEMDLMAIFFGRFFFVYKRFILNHFVHKSQSTNHSCI